MMNMETKKLLLVLASLLVSLSVSAQKYTDDELDVAVRQAFKKTDVQWNNLKGNVVITRTKKLGFKKAYGEWVPGGTAPGEHEGEEYVVYGSSGNYLLKMIWGRENPDFIRFFNYNAWGNLSSIDIYRYNYYYGFKPKGEFADLDAIWMSQLMKGRLDPSQRPKDRFITDKRSVYEYQDGRIKTIITRPVGSPDDEGGARDIFRNESDGSYTMTRYKDDGREDMSFQVSADGRKEIRKSDYIVAYIERDKDGRMIDVGGGGGGSNGYATQRSYYEYNDHGDLLYESSQVKLVDRDKDIKWLEQQRDVGEYTYFEYEYDAKGNWTTRKMYRHYSMNKEIDLKRWETREIVYAEDLGKTGDEYIAERKKEVDAYFDKQAEKAAKQVEEDRLKDEHPYVKYDGDLAEDILQGFLPNLPKVSALKALGGAEGYVTIKLTVNRNGALTARAADDYSNRWERAQLIVQEAIKAANNLSKSPKWIPGYGGVTCSIDFYYYPGGKVSASGAQYKYD